MVGAPSVPSARRRLITSTSTCRTAFRLRTKRPQGGARRALVVVGADPRRLRPYRGVPGGALLPRRQGGYDLGGDERDPAAHHLPGAGALRLTPSTTALRSWHAPPALAVS